jgi:hypothetical protein
MSIIIRGSLLLISMLTLTACNSAEFGTADKRSSRSLQDGAAFQKDPNEGKLGEEGNDGRLGEEGSEDGWLEEEEQYKDGCDTAFAQGQQTFIEMGLTNGRWGWQLTIQDESGSVPIYAGAGQNDISKGYKAGSLEYSYDGQQLQVKYVMEQGIYLQETHLYAGAADLPTIAPGQYGNQHGLDNASSDSFSLSVSGSSINIVAHAKVCQSMQ